MRHLTLIASFSGGDVWRLPASAVYDSLIATLADEYSCTTKEAIARFEASNERDQKINLLQYGNMMSWDEIKDEVKQLKRGLEPAMPIIEWPSCDKHLMDANEIARMLESWAESIERV